MLYCISGHTPSKERGKYDPGAVANGVTEADLTRELRNLISEELTRRGRKHVIDHDADDLRTVLSKINSNETDVIFDIHFNAATPQATGVEVIIPARSTDLERRSAEACVKSLATIMGIRSRGVKDETQTARKRLAVMQKSGCNLLLETCFITNKSDLDAYLAKKKEVAVYLAELLIWIEEQA